MSEHNDYGDPTPAATMYVGLIGVLIFVLVVIYLTALYHSTNRHEQAVKLERDENTLSPLQVNRNEQQGMMQGYHYVHDYADGAGRVTMPVDQAKARVLEQFTTQNQQRPQEDGAGN
ncbi:MAG: hypothetical protein ACR2GY_05690 [Phycisphaerales bacterium]